MLTYRTSPGTEFERHIGQLNDDMRAADRALEQGNKMEARRIVSRMRGIIKAYGQDVGNSAAAYDTFTRDIIPHLEEQVR